MDGWWALWGLWGQLRKETGNERRYGGWKLGGGQESRAYPTQGLTLAFKGQVGPGAEGVSLRMQQAGQQGRVAGVQSCLHLLFA